MRAHADSPRRLPTATGSLEIAVTSTRNDTVRPGQDAPGLVPLGHCLPIRNLDRWMHARPACARSPWRWHDSSRATTRLRSITLHIEIDSRCSFLETPEAGRCSNCRTLLGHKSAEIRY